MPDIVLTPYGKDTTLVGVNDIRGNDAVEFSNHDVVVAIMQWLREVDKTTLYNLIGAIVLEHQVSAHINTLSEKERIQALNMQREDLILIFVRALAAASFRDPENQQSSVYATIEDIHVRLQEWHTDVPQHVVFTFLKTLEHFIGRVVDVGEGYFKIVETTQGMVSEEQRVNAIKRELETLSEEGREQIQVRVVNSLKGTPYEI